MFLDYGRDSRERQSESRKIALKSRPSCEREGEREGGRYGGKREAGGGGLLDWEAPDGLTDLRRRYAKSIKLQK